MNKYDFHTYLITASYFAVKHADCYVKILRWSCWWRKWIISRRWQKRG